MENRPQITQVEKNIKDTLNNKVDLWVRWHSEDSINGEYGYKSSWYWTKTEYK